MIVNSMLVGFVFYVACYTWFDGGSIITLKHKLKDLLLRLASYRQFDGCAT